MQSRLRCRIEGRVASARGGADLGLGAFRVLRVGGVLVLLVDERRGGGAALGAGAGPGPEAHGFHEEVIEGGDGRVLATFDALGKGGNGEEEAGGQ